MDIPRQKPVIIIPAKSISAFVAWLIMEKWKKLQSKPVGPVQYAMFKITGPRTGSDVEYVAICFSGALNINKCKKESIDRILLWVETNAK